MSDVTLQELTQVLMRPRFDRYVSQESRQRFLALLAGVARPVHITRHFQVCRDPKDDAFSDLAFNGHARSLITGDQDLLVLDTCFIMILIVNDIQLCQDVRDFD